MTTNVSLNNPSLLSPIVFRADFNHFEKINATQAWSIFFTRGREDKALGRNLTVGRFFNLSLMAIAIASILWTFMFQPF
ncbi:hypothetical protein [Calothrix sp. UHCC 0171]|uniref:hypothetical protein n=1 Tax=Calothrix sp. UHCC 0171 TaxID=3110245 RepID=UPI002B21C24D|nr:hypothetical protein [Calothrix sp. UHCC 0171]MEA5571137.1 hypothetical protein [Calothrix sp. UHCC 0171]